MAFDKLESFEMKNCAKRNQSNGIRFAGSISEEEELAHCLVLLSRGGSGLRSVNESPSEKHVFCCSVCGRKFKSYQALGGHKTGHKKPASSTVDVAASSPEQLAGKHKCNICFKSFPSGQALGGHKRLHYDKHVEAGELKFEFDLNLPALAEEEETGVVSKKPRI